jgi:hypothetical protein
MYIEALSKIRIYFSSPQPQSSSPQSSHFSSLAGSLQLQHAWQLPLPSQHIVSSVSSMPHFWHFIE